MATILITRPQEDATSLFQALLARGHTPLSEPMLTIIWRDAPPLPDWDTLRIQSLLFTSANGVRALTRRTSRRDLPVFAVGPATAAEAEASGFAPIVTAGGDVTALVAQVAALCRPANGPLFHAAGSVTAGDLSGQLNALGFNVLREVLYESRPATALSSTTSEFLINGALDAVTLFSPRTARSLCALIVSAGLQNACRRITAYCLSQAVADAACNCPWLDCKVPPYPNQESLLDILK
ncbi:Uroporphyrinogen-III synthase [Azospirillaceae bacterium]